MKFSFKSLSLFASFALAFSAHATTAIDTDLLVGFKAANSTTDVVIDLGSVNNYTAPGTYMFGNFAAILSATFGADWNARTGTNAVTWGAVADYTDNIGVIPSTVWLTSKWLATGSAGGAKSVSWGSRSQSQIDVAYSRVGNVLTGINASGGYTLGQANTLSATSLNSWSRNDTNVNSFGFVPSALFNNQASRLANSGVIGDASSASVSDLYLLANDGTTGSSTLVGAIALYQNGDMGFLPMGDFPAPIVPEPSTYALILGAMTIGFVSLRRKPGLS